MQTKEFAAPDVEGQAEQVMLNLGAILDASGSSFGQVRGPLASTAIMQGQPNVFIMCLQVPYLVSRVPVSATALFFVMCRTPLHSTLNALELCML